MLKNQENPKQKCNSQKSLIHLSLLNFEEIQNIFSTALKFKMNFESIQAQKKSSGIISLLFFENSSRTRISFEMAAKNLGLNTILLDAQSGSSLHKGESLEDTILNVAAMEPRALVVRSGDDLNMDEISKKISVPIINAGWGKRGHPSQALLDLFTIQQEKPLQGFKLLIVGDILHSRVAFSHFEICQKLGVEIAGCGPESFKPTERDLAQVSQKNIKWFDNIEDALTWCDGVMALRVQTERHQDKAKFDILNYKKKFGINKENLRHLRSDGLLLHPGPVNWGVELDFNIVSDSRVRILKQVNNGLFIRMALLDLYTLI